MKKEEVHPRPCGEYGVRLSEQKVHKGSPPLTRGIRTPRCACPPPVRFTPAHAGNTDRHNILWTGSEVHPRPRGEYVRNVFAVPASPGSPPPMRGIQMCIILFIGSPRFTPAHAGNTEEKIPYPVVQ